MRRSSRLAVPLRRPEDVIPHLGERFHWKHGRSAKALADYWWDAVSLPAPIGEVLAQSPDFAEAELLEAWVERETDLQDGEGRPSQTDLLALLGVGSSLAVLGIEAKAGEPFGPTVHARLRDGSAGVRRRVEQLCSHLGIGIDDAHELRYQLLHRTVATLLECRRFRASKAVLLVQSFRDDPKGLADYQRFARAIGMPAIEPGTLGGPRHFAGIGLWTAWVASDVPACGLVIAALRRTTTTTPTQWEGALTDGRPIYIRYRWGELSVRIGKDGETIDQAAEAVPWFEGAVGGANDSGLDLSQVLSATGLILAPALASVAS